jgi:aldose 1-epimerase
MNSRSLIYLIILISIFFHECESKKTNSKMEDIKSAKQHMVNQVDFITTIEGKPVELYNLKNSNGMVVQITNYGGKIVSIIVPDKDGNFDDVVTGYDNIEGYISGENSFGATIGRYGNRIANGKFVLDGVEYSLAQNNGKNHIHGGLKNFSNTVWDVVKNGTTDQKLTLHYLSMDGEEGYPGNLDVRVVFTLSEKNELIIDYNATTDKKTIINLTNHSYFNLAGGNFQPVYNHKLQISAKQFVPGDNELIPLGEFWDVANTPMDFNNSTPIGQRINDDYDQLKIGGGYDHTFVLANDHEELIKYAEVTEPETGRTMECWTTEPGVQLYTASHLNGSRAGKKGVKYQKHSAFCLETHHYPDSPNQPQFPSTTLTPDEMYKTTSIYKFGTK